MKNLYLFIVFIVWSNFYWGQTKVLSIDMANPTEWKGLEDLEDLKKGDFYSIKIENINLNIWKVQISKTDSIIKVDVPFPSFDLINLGGIGEMLENLNLSTISQLNQSPIASFNSADNAIIKKEVDLAKRINDTIQKNKLLIERKVALINGYQKQIDEMVLNLNKKILWYEVDNNRVSALFNLVINPLLPTNILIDSVNDLRQIIKLESDTLFRLKQNYLLFGEDNEVKKFLNSESNKEYKESYDLITDAYSELITLVDKIYEGINAEKLMIWLAKIVEKENNRNTTFMSFPQQFNGDITTLKVTVKPHKPESNLPAFETEIKFPVKKRYFLGFGSSFYISSLYNQSFSVKADTSNSSTNYRIVDESPIKAEIGISALIHGGSYFKNHPNIAYHFTLGPGIGISNKVQPRLSFGGGFSFGNKNMFSVDLLGVSGFVQKKSRAFSLDDTYSVKPEQITVSKLSFGIGVAIGYVYRF
jgi:hypothetical protein